MKGEDDDDEGSDTEDGLQVVREPTPKYVGGARTETWTQPLVPGWKESEDYVAEAERRKFMTGARDQLVALTRGEGSPWLWERIGQAYMCAIPGHFNDEPANCLRIRVESDGQLLDAALRGLPYFAHRADLPPLAGIVQLDRTRDGDRYCYPVLASLAATSRLGGDPLRQLGGEGIRRAAGSYYLADYVNEPCWYRRAIDRHPDLCADALATVYRSLIRRRIRHNNHLFALSDDNASAGGGAAGGTDPARRLPDAVYEGAGLRSPRSALGRPAPRAQGGAG